MSSDTADIAEVAREAREALAAAPGGTLHVCGARDMGADGVDAPFGELDGRPTFWCPSASPVVAAAAREPVALLAVDVAEHRRLVLVGHLAIDGTPSDGVVAVGLEVHTVLVEDEPPNRPLRQQQVPLAAWLAASPDPLAGTARRLLQHTNDHHGADLRSWIAGLRGLHDHDVIAAELVTLDADGLGVRWLDVRGAHDVRVRFPQRAGCPGALASALRDTLHAD